MERERKVKMTVRAFKARKDLILQMKNIMGYTTESDFFNHLFNEWIETKGVIWINMLRGKESEKK